MIHTITAYARHRDLHRVFGWYPTRGGALHAVSQNHADMHECLYTYLVVEAVEPGIHGMASDEAWFKWTQGIWQGCPPPAWAEGVCNHSMG